MRLAQEQQRQGGKFKGGGRGFHTSAAEQEVYPAQDRAADPPPPVQPPPRMASRPSRVPGNSMGSNRSGFNNVNGVSPRYRSGSEKTAPPSFDRDSRQHGKKYAAPGRSAGWSPSPSASRESSTPSPSSYRGNSNTDASGSRQKSKLPHGLTVQELKEMTKARLQAEAADKVDDTRLLQTPEPHTIPTAVNETRTAPPPTPSYHEGWNPDHRADGWETASTGTANSDAFANTEYSPDFDFNRARSYTDSQGVVHPTHVYSSSGTPPFYDNSMSFPQNRRRAATLSPRIGLSHVQEDYPADGSMPMPSMPMSSSHSHGPAIQARPVSAFTPNPPFGFPGNVNSGGNQNRPRASSAVSLPPMSHTADEFDLEPTRRSSPFGVVREDCVTPGLSDVFRDNSFSPVPSLMSDLGLYSDNRTRAATWSESFISSGTPAELSDDLASLLKLAAPDE